jgi:hypothetical protein
MRSVHVLIAFSALVALAPAAHAEGDVVSYIEARATVNPAPSAPLSTFDRFEISPIDMVEPYAGQDPNEEAKGRIQTNLDERVTPLFAKWNSVEAKNAPPRTLKVEPTIRHIKFISGKARFWAGAFAGGSAVLMTVKLSDAASGELIAEPEFYQHANAMGAAWTVGGTDKAMLVRVADLIATYLDANYAAAMGGPTGKEEPRKGESEKGRKR